MITHQQSNANKDNHSKHCCGSTPLNKFKTFQNECNLPISCESGTGPSYSGGQIVFFTKEQSVLHQHCSWEEREPWTEQSSRQPGFQQAVWRPTTQAQLQVTPLPSHSVHVHEKLITVRAAEQMTVHTSKSVVMRTRLEPERNSLMIKSLSFWSMSPC